MLKAQEKPRKQMCAVCGNLTAKNIFIFIFVLEWLQVQTEEKKLTLLR